jgi:hypothetical protein
MTTSNAEWIDIILGKDDAATKWLRIFDALRDTALQSTKLGALDRATVAPDQLLANSAWDLWDEFLPHAPLAIDELKKFWAASKASGRAILILDGLSLRELPIIVNAARDRGITPVRVEARGSQLPTETDRFAEALGVSSRSKLRNNQAPSTFIFSGPDVYSTVFVETPFADCFGEVTSHPHLFYWHTWPDEPLIHGNAQKEDALSLLTAQTKRQLAGEDFWAFIDRLRQGRRLVITADHGYAHSHAFSDEVQNPETIQLLRNTFGAKRNSVESPNAPWPRHHLPPLVAKLSGRLAVIGQRKWSVQGGFPRLCHGGLSLLEAAVPYIELPEL